MGVLGTSINEPTGATGEQNLRLLAKSTDELRAAAAKNKYPGYVHNAAGVKVLVHDEAEHRDVAPADFPKPKADGK